MKIAADLYTLRMQSLSIDVSNRDDGVVVLRLVGAAGLTEEATMSRPLNALAASRPRRLIIDLSGLEFLASLAIGQLVSVVRAVQSHGGVAVMACAPAQIHQVMMRSGMDRLLPQCATMEDAERALAASA